ncbi:RNA-dependent RNA polymerase [Culex tritaeniorhynchus Anphevirus]|uniref:RNA-directed RNA polymerase n=1 Tax=Culex tritaeniorhynchus Anphevirus TaxID=2684266 RepID=A0AAD1LZ80_9MONO|nr:RNA-dependent RNA polymerase [Culex tritaeniorhynchus Anphevirus]BBQ04822.1 RNA-dependent RNA polymerase [Culex tritaeniorhynchus Anphevirus]
MATLTEKILNEPNSDDDCPLWGESSQERKRKKKLADKAEFPRITCINGHLMSAITEEDAIFLLKNDASTFKRCKRHYKWKEFVTKSFPKTQLIGEVFEDPLGELICHINDLKVSVNNDFKRCVKSMDLINLHKIDFLKPVLKPVLEGETLKKIVARTNAFKNSALELLGDYELKKKAEMFKDAVCFKEIKDGERLSYHRMHMDADLVLWESRRGPVLFSTNLLLCALDKAQSQFNTFLYWKLCDVVNKYPTKSIYKRGKELHSIFESLRPKMGQDFFELMGTYESFIIGWVIGDPEDLGCTDLFVSQHEEMHNLLVKHGVRLEILEEILPDSRAIFDVLMALELTGISKMFGYPTLEADKMLKQILKYGVNENHEISSELIMELKGVVTRELMYNQYSQHEHYLKARSFPPELKQLAGARGPVSNKYHNNYALWAQVVFDKNFDFNYNPDMMKIINDTAAAPPRSDWSSMYDPCAFRAKYGKDPPKIVKQKAHTRVINAFLEADEGHVRQLIDERDNGIVRLEDFICVECQKECELKCESGRAFTKQTPDQRLIQVSLEHNVAEQIFPLVPEQSMIHGEIHNVRRVLSHVEKMQGTSHFISLDLKKWCLFQRHASTHFIGEIYDQLFGLNRLYADSHLFFNNSYVLTNHRLQPPDYDNKGNPVESEVFTKSFVGGMEGMHQKKWTHVAIALIRLAMEKSGVIGEIMGQGDNQVIILNFASSDTQADLKRTRFLRVLETLFNQLGHELKEKETWYSRYLHEYSKQRVYKGIAVSFGTKKSLSVIADINDGLFAIQSSLSTLNTCTESIARADYGPDPAFCMNLFNITDYLLRKKFCRPDEEGKILMLLLCPVDFGGLSLSNYVNHTVRGNDDKITQWMSLLLTAQRLFPDYYSAMMKIWRIAPERPANCAEERRNLFEDIFSLNIPQHPSADKQVKDLVEEYLRSDVIKNKMIRNLYDPIYSQTLSSLVENLDTMTPMYPALAHELMVNSNAGLFIKMQSKLTSSKTLEKVVQERVAKTLISMIRENNEKLIKSVKTSLEGSRTSTNQALLKGMSCPSAIAEKLRVLSWGKELIGVTKAPFQHQVSIIEEDDEDLDILKPAITIRLTAKAVERPAFITKEYGTMRSFTGATTGEKLKKATLSVKERSSFTDAMSKIGKIKSWMELLGSTNLVALCDILLEEKRPLIGDVDAKEVFLEDFCSSVYGGTITHRFKSSAEKDTAMVNCLPSVTGHFEYSSDSLKLMTAGGKDFSVFYQYLYVSSTLAFSMIGELHNHLYPRYRMIFNDCSCTKEMPNPQLDLSKPPLGKLSVKPLKAIETEVSQPKFDILTIKSMMSYEIGMKLAAAVERDFRREHARGDSNPSVKTRKTSISLNDLRLLNIEDCLFSMVLNSHHCRILYKNKGNINEEGSSDKSFFVPAGLVLGSESVPHFIEWFGEADEHSAVSQVEGIARHMSRRIYNFVQKYIREKPDLSVFRFTNDYQFMIRESISFINYLKNQQSHGRNPRYHLVNNLIHTRSGYSLAACLLGVNYHNTRLEREQVLMMWRSSDKGENIHRPSRVIQYSSDLNLKAHYPRSEIMNYHLSRREDKTGNILASQICFIARPLGSISSGFNKFFECAQASGTLQHLSTTKGYAYFLAEGSGGNCALSSIVYPNLKIFYNTWLAPEVCNRDSACDEVPPAFYAKLISTESLMPDNPLIRGETDITKDCFVEKMMKCMESYPPTLITLDAESPKETNNLEFLVKTILPVLEKHKPIVFLKMFQIAPILHTLESILVNKLKGFLWTMFKPISSNPNGCEFYLIIIPDSLTSRVFSETKTVELAVASYLEPCCALTYDQLQHYESIARSMSLFFRTAVTDNRLIIRHRYSDLVDQGLCCNLFCPRFYEMVIEQLDGLHFNPTSVFQHLFIRLHGTNPSLHALLHDFVFLTLYHGSHLDMCRIIETTQRIRVCEISQMETRRSTSMACVDFLLQPSEGDIWASWRDARMYMRDYGMLTGTCPCHFTTKYWKNTKNTQYLAKMSISYPVATLFYQSRLINKDFGYFKMRVELKEPVVIKASAKRDSHLIDPLDIVGTVREIEEQLRNEAQLLH